MPYSFTVNYDGDFDLYFKPLAPGGFFSTTPSYTSDIVEQDEKNTLQKKVSFDGIPNGVSGWVLEALTGNPTQGDPEVEYVIAPTTNSADDLAAQLAVIAASTGLITSTSVAVVGTTINDVDMVPVTTYVRDTGPISIPTLSDLSATSVELVVSEWRNLKWLPIYTVANSGLTKTSSSITLPITAAVYREATTGGRRQLEYAIRETSSKNTRQKGPWNVEEAPRNFT